MSDISKKIDSIEKLAKEAERLAKNLQTNPFLEFDRIAKDIQEQKDNAMAMEFTKCIGELLKKNGVVQKITEYTRNFETDNTFETRYGVSIDELDFSEHDKVFEDKIDEQKNEISMLKSLIDNYRDAESKLFDENKELKQRIDELESKESVKPMRIEIHADNGEVLTPLEVANSLINLGYERPLKENEVSVSGKPSVRVNTFSVNDLKEISDYLNVYSRHHQKDTETISF